MRQYYSNITPVFPDPALYSPDFSYMDKMLQRKEQQYNQGYNKVANLWSYMSRPVTNAENAKLRDSLLKQAKEKLKNISSLDLSQYQNVESAMNVFAPYYNNTDLIGDQAFTQFLNEQENIAEGYRNTEGGKYFSEENLNNIRIQRAEFANAKPSDWKNFYQNRKKYTPYYDVTGEYTEAMKNFKPSSVTTINKNGAYITTITDKSWYKEDISRYLDGTLSQKAKEQWNIQAYNRTKNNPNGVLKSFLDKTKLRLPAIDTELKSINLAIIKAKSPEEKQLLENNKKYFEQLKVDLSEKISKIESGDQNFIKSNLEQIGKILYIDEQVDNIADAYKHKEVDQKLEFDQWLMTQYKEQEANYRARLHEAGADRRKRWELGIQDGVESAPDIIVPNYEGDEQEQKTQSFYKQESEEARKVVEEKRQQITNHIRASRSDSEDKTVTEDDVNDWIAANSNSSLALQFGVATAQYNAKKQMFEQVNNQADDYARQQMGEVNYNNYKRWEQERNKAKTAYTPDLSQNQQYVNRMRGDMATPLTNVQKYQISVNANSIASKKTGVENGSQLEEAYNQYKNQYVSKPKEEKINTYGKVFTENIPTFKQKKAELSGVLNVDPNQIINVTAVPNVSRGLDLEIKLKPAKENESFDNIVSSIKNSIKTRTGAEVINVNENEGTIYVKGLGRGLSSFKDMDYYGEVNSAFYPQIQALTSFRGPAQSQITMDFPAKDASGVNRRFSIRKVMGTTPGINDMYMLINPLDGKNINPKEAFNNVMIPYRSMAFLLANKSEVLDEVLLQAKIDNAKK